MTAERKSRKDESAPESAMRRVRGLLWLMPLARFCLSVSESKYYVEETNSIGVSMDRIWISISTKQEKSRRLVLKSGDI